MKDCTAIFASFVLDTSGELRKELYTFSKTRKTGSYESRAAAPAWGCEARLELDAAGSVNRLKASRVGALPNPRNPSGCLQEQFLTTRLLFGIPISIPK